jgi:hypothetical protein
MGNVGTDFGKKLLAAQTVENFVFGRSIQPSRRIIGDAVQFPMLHGCQ